MFDATNIAFAVIAVVGAVLCILWVYNSTNKERLQFLRRARAFRSRAMMDELERGARYQRIAFASAFIGTGSLIFAFEYFYWRKYGVPIASGYNYAAGALIALGALTLVISLLTRNK